MNDMPRTRALGLIRLSRSADPASTSIPRQQEIVEGYAQRENMDIIGWAIDPAVSAFKYPPEKRKQIRAWLERSDEYDCIVYWRQDRIVRRARDFMGIVQWCQTQGKKLYSATEGLGDVTQHAGMLIGFITAWQAEGESLSTSARVKTSIEKLDKEGRWRGGRSNFGKKAICLCHELPKCPDLKEVKGWKLIVDENGEAPVAREAARRVIAGESVNAVTGDFNERGIRPRDGKYWHAVILRRILRNPSMMDLISTQEYAQLQIALDRRSQDRTVRTIGHEALCLDVVFCGRCRGKIYRQQPAQRNGSLRNLARCRNVVKRAETLTPCDLPDCPYPDLEQMLTDDLRINYGDWLIETRVTDTTRRVRADEIDRELMALSAEFTAKRIDRTEFRKRQDDLLDEQESLIAARNGSGNAPEWKPTGETVAQLWARLSNAERRLWLLRIGAVWLLHCQISEDGKRKRFTVRKWERVEDQDMLRERIVRPA